MANFEAYEQFLKEATTPGPTRTLPGLVVAAVDANGLIYSHAAGTWSVDPNSAVANEPFILDTTMWFASCTKLMTSLSALQCVERGLLSLDAPIYDVIKELEYLPILTGWKTEGDKEVPQFEKNNTPITLRHLLSHSSGLGYAAFHPELGKLFAYKGLAPEVDVDEFFANTFAGALLFAPGTSWTYGVGIDMAGLAVSRITGMPLQDYFAKEFFGPLGMTNSSFRVTPAIKAARADMAARAPDGTLVASPTRLYSDDAKIDGGGAGLWSCARDYTKVLQAVLAKPSPLFKDAKTLDLAFTPVLGKKSKADLNKLIFDAYPGNESGAIGAMYSGGTLPLQGVEVTYTLVGLAVVGGLEGKRGGEGKAVSWSGLPNLVWCVDREKGRAVFIGSQLLPPGDRGVADAFNRLEALVFGPEGAKL